MSVNAAVAYIVLDDLSSFPLCVGDNFVVRTGRHVDMVINDPSISDLHAEITVGYGPAATDTITAYLKDLRSNYGTYVKFPGPNDEW